MCLSERWWNFIRNINAIITHFNAISNFHKFVLKLTDFLVWWRSTLCECKSLVSSTLHGICLLVFSFLVSLFVCEHRNSTTYCWIFFKFWYIVYICLSKSLLNFGDANVTVIYLLFLAGVTGPTSALQVTSRGRPCAERRMAPCTRNTNSASVLVSLTQSIITMVHGPLFGHWCKFRGAVLNFTTICECWGIIFNPVIWVARVVDYVWLYHFIWDIYISIWV